MNRASSATGWVRNPDGTLGWTWNPLSGCLNHTPEGLCLGGMFPCYAFKLANGRLKQRYLANENIARSGYPIPKNLNELPCDENDPFYPRFWDNRLEELRQRNRSLIERGLDKPRGIFVCDMGELFGNWLPLEWTEAILNEIDNKHDRFYLLTKQPQNLIKFSPFPENCWVGVTATDMDMLFNAVNCLCDVKASVKYASIEPFLSWGDTSKFVYPLESSLKEFNWLIIGACTGTKYGLMGVYDGLLGMMEPYPELTPMLYGKRWTLQPKIEWVEEVESAARKAGVPIFEKDNLKPLLQRDLIQEMPPKAKSKRRGL